VTGPPPAPRRLALALVLVLVAALVAAGCGGDADPGRFVPAPSAPATTSPPPPPPFQGWSDPAGVGQPYGDTVDGLLTFRGNPTRTYYGTGPVPRTEPSELWRYPASGGLCSQTAVGDEVSTWCGTGWTGQPAVFERDGRTWLVVGAYDAALHFLDARTGEPILPRFPVGDLIKGSVTIDPDGYPLAYIGSRDNYYRVIAFDRDEPTELWRLGAYDVSPTMWDNDWDGAGLIIDDYLLIGGENSVFHIVKLNRGMGSDGRVTVDPELVFHAPGWDEQVLRDFGSNQMAIENSVAVFRDTVYFANSGGLVQGWDLSGFRAGDEPERVFRFWTGDDVDASVVVDEHGMLYVGVEYEIGNARSREVGQMIKLDPGRPDDPLVWSVPDHDTLPSGIWGTPALFEDIVIFGTNGGRVLGLDRDTGDGRWTLRLTGPVWQSPVVIDGVLVIGDCAGEMHAFDIADTRAEPEHLWTHRIGGGCIESTPAVWRGVIYVGTRAGAIHALGPD
jgi:outer membrane protein assembly factor BamB